jgi:hypothetical protein
MKINIGDYEVLETGSVIGNENEPIDFIIHEQLGFIVRFEFDKDDSKEQKAKAENFGSRGVKLTFTNYDNSLGTGNIIPLPIGTLEGRKLFINYRIYSLEKGGKHMHYTWLLAKKEVVNG